MARTRFPISGAIAFFALTLSQPVTADVKVHGATTVAFGLLKPHQKRIEELAGVKRRMLPSSTTHGLADLVEGKADIAMLAEPLETIAASMNISRPGFVDVETLASVHVGNAYVQFIVHPAIRYGSSRNINWRICSRELPGIGRRFLG